MDDESPDGKPLNIFTLRNQSWMQIYKLRVVAVTKTWTEPVYGGPKGLTAKKFYEQRGRPMPENAQTRKNLKSRPTYRFKNVLALDAKDEATEWFNNNKAVINFKKGRRFRAKHAKQQKQ